MELAGLVGLARLWARLARRLAWRLARLVGRQVGEASEAAGGVGELDELVELARLARLARQVGLPRQWGLARQARLRARGRQAGEAGEAAGVGLAGLAELARQGWRRLAKLVTWGWWPIHFQHQKTSSLEKRLIVKKTAIELIPELLRACLAGHLRVPKRMIPFPSSRDPPSKKRRSSGTLVYKMMMKEIIPTSCLHPCLAGPEVVTSVTSMWLEKRYQPRIRN